MKKTTATPAPATQAVPPAELRIARATPGEGAAGPADYFTGEVRIATHYQSDAPARIGGAAVSFAAGARTAWHSHPLGQTLYIVSGTGWVRREGGSIEVVRPGDVVWIPAHLRHWHGASATEPMTHFAVAESLDGTAVTWMEKVTDADYDAGPADDDA